MTFFSSASCLRGRRAVGRRSHCCCPPISVLSRRLTAPSTGRLGENARKTSQKGKKPNTDAA